MLPLSLHWIVEPGSLTLPAGRSPGCRMQMLHLRYSKSLPILVSTEDPVVKRKKLVITFLFTAPFAVGCNNKQTTS